MNQPKIAYIALSVESLRQAENFYCTLFELETLAWEAPRSEDKNQHAATTEVEAVGFVPEWSFLGRDGLCLALRRAAVECSGQGRLDHICVRIPPSDVCSLQARAEELGCRIAHRASGSLLFEDLYGVQWQIIADAA